MSSVDGRFISLLEAKKIVGLKTNAFKDYLAARVLFNQELLLQATLFANTAIEKEIKGYLEARGILVPKNIRHNTKKLYELLTLHIPQEAKKLNKEFIEELSRIYKARYTDTLEIGFNFTIIRNKYLAELDFSYSILEPLFKFKIERLDDFGDSAYEKAIKENDFRLFLNNHVLGNISKEDFFKKTDIVKEFRILPNNELLEVIYKIPSTVDDGKYMFEALIPLSNNSVQLSHKTNESGYF